MLAMAAGWDWGGYLVTYFVAASALSRFRAEEKARRTGAAAVRSGARDAVQVAANGALFGIAAAAYAIEPGIIAMAIGVASLAASAADTWATEIGSLSKDLPRSAWSMQPVSPGTSGGVTPLGIAASLAAGLFSSLVALAIGWPMVIAVAALVGAITGSAVDSILGASLQGRFWCDSCAAETEARVHLCGSHTRTVGGWSWLDNDGVNLAATVAGAVDGAVVVYLIGA